MPAKKTKKSASTKAGKYVKEEMHAMKSGSKKVKTRKQAIAVGLSRARKAGIKVGKKTASKKTTSSSSTKKASKSSAKKRVSMKTSPRSNASTRETKSTGTKGRPHSSEREFSGADSTEQQTPLASLDSHVDATREMGVTVAANAPKKAPMNEKVKAQNKTAKNVSHTRSHSSQYRG